MVGHWKKGKILEAKYEAKLKFLEGRGNAKLEGSIDIFWKYT